MNLNVLRILASVLSGLLLFLIFLYIFFPAGKIETLAIQSLAKSGVTVKTGGVHKTVIPGLAWDSIRLYSETGEIIALGSTGIRIKPLSLLTGKLEIRALASIASGTLEINAELWPGKSCTVAGIGINTSGIPYFKEALGGSLNSTLGMTGNVDAGPKGLAGEVRLELKSLGYSGLNIGGIRLPDANDLNAQGMLRITPDHVTVESINLQGNDIFMRLSGDLPKSARITTDPLNITLEIMPKPEFMEKQKLVFMLLAKFISSPGVYRIPVRGTLLKPSII